MKDVFTLSSEEIAILKSVLPELPFGFEQTYFGDPMGSKRQFRSRSGLHVREYDDRFVIHMDRFDPRSDPMLHLLFDSPETVLAAGTVLRLAKSANNKEAHHFLSPLAFLLAFISFNSIFRKLKHFFLG